MEAVRSDTDPRILIKRYTDRNSIFTPPFEDTGKGAPDLYPGEPVDE